MSSSQENGLSPEELRKRLYQTFKNKGVLDTLKVQLRNQLIQELKCPQEPASRPVSETKELLLLSACNSIVSDHLVASGYEYTLSVFSPECGLSKDKILKKEGLLHILKIHPASPHYSSMVNAESNDKGFLFSLLKHLTDGYPPSLCHDVETQTTSLQSYGESLVEKMKMIDKEYESVSFSDDRIFPFQSKLSAYKRETEAQMEAEMNTKLHHFKEVEIAKVRMEEKSKFHKEFDRLKQELERNYEMKTKVLMEREKNAIDRLQKQQEIEEKNIYMQRQSVLKDIESVRNQENELRRRTEAFEQTCQTQAETVKATEELLRRRELAVKTVEDTYDQKLKNELSRYQLELKEEFMKRTEKLTESENRNKEETARIQKESDVINATFADHDRTRSERKRLQIELETAQQQTSLLTQQNNVLKERLESTGDYLSLKKERAELQGQVELLKQQLQKAQEESQRLHAERVRPSEAQLALQKELQRLQSARRVDEEDFNNQKQLLQMQLQSEVDRCAQLKAQLLESEERSQWMSKHVDDIKVQLRQTQQALENEVLRHPKPSVLVPPDIYMDRALPRAGVGSDDICEAGGPSRGYKPPWIDSPDSDLSEAKARILELQKEVESVEEAYWSYQQRAAHSTVSHMLPPKPTSLQHSCHSHSPSFPLRKQDSHIHSTHKSKTLVKPVSSQRAQSPTLFSYDAKRLLPPVQLGITVSEDDALPLKTAFSHHLLAEALFPNDESSSSRKLQEENAEVEEIVSPVVFPPSLSDRLLSGAPLCEAGITGDFSPDLSPPHSPQLRSTAREQPRFALVSLSPPSLESSPQPERINMEDLTGSDSEPGHIPKLLLDTAVPLSEEAPDGPSTPHPQDLPEDPSDLHGQAEVPQALGHSARTEEVEEQKWERERKEREERRQRELEEAKERELRELEQLEMLSQQEEPLEREEETDVKKGENEEQEEESKGEDPMEKYMMVLQAGQKQSPVRQESGQMSPEEKSLSEEMKQSVAACSLKDDEDDFW